MIRIAMEMVGVKPVNVNACLIMSMHKIALIMDVSTFIYSYKDVKRNFLFLAMCTMHNNEFQEAL